MNYNKLKGRIIEKFGTLGLFAEALGISRIALYYKLKGRNDFSTKDIIKIVELLEIEPEEIGDYFFSAEVYK